MGVITHCTKILPLTEAHCLESCRFALAPIAADSGEVFDPQTRSKWSFVIKNAHVLAGNCPAKKLGGGVTFIAGLATCPHQLHRTS